MIDQMPPIVTGQRLQVLQLIRKYQPIHSFVLTSDYAIPEAAARITELRSMGFNIITTIIPEMKFRGEVKRRSAMYSLGTPEWPSVSFTQQTVA